MTGQKEIRGRSSVAERHLAKVEVAGSIPAARSKYRTAAADRRSGHRAATPSPSARPAGWSRTRMGRRGVKKKSRS